MKYLPGVDKCKPTNIDEDDLETSQTISGCDIKVIESTVDNNASVVFDAYNSTTIFSDFTVYPGTTLTIQ
jgi:hypothetical protein